MPTSEINQIEPAISALETQPAILGDGVVDIIPSPIPFPFPGDFLCAVYLRTL